MGVIFDLIFFKEYLSNSLYASDLKVLIERKNLAKPAWLRYKIEKATETGSEKNIALGMI